MEKVTSRKQNDADQHGGVTGFFPVQFLLAFRVFPILFFPWCGLVLYEFLLGQRNLTTSGGILIGTGFGLLFVWFIAVAYATLSAKCPTIWKVRSLLVLTNACIGTGYALWIVRDAVRRVDEGAASLGVGAVFVMGLVIVLLYTNRLAAERKLGNTIE